MLYLVPGESLLRFGRAQGYDPNRKALTGTSIIYTIAKGSIRSPQYDAWWINFWRSLFVHPFRKGRPIFRVTRNHISSPAWSLIYPLRRGLDDFSMAADYARLLLFLNGPSFKNLSVQWRKVNQNFESIE